jgi:hypothetical protein
MTVAGLMLTRLLLASQRLNNARATSFRLKVGRRFYRPQTDPYLSAKQFGGTGRRLKRREAPPAGTQPVRAR